MGKGQRPSCFCHFLKIILFQMFNLPRSHILAVACSVVCQPLYYQWVSLVAQMVKTLPAVQETWTRFLDQEDPLQKEIAAHFIVLHSWRIPRTQEPGRLQSMKLQIVGHDWATNTHTHTHIPLLGEACWLKPPTLARHHSNYLHGLFYDRRSW